MAGTIMNENPNLKKKSWDEFRATGLLWFVNRILHVFGWCIVIEMDPDSPDDISEEKSHPLVGPKFEVYPARTRWRGFQPANEQEGYEKVTRWMAEKGSALALEIMPDEETKRVPDGSAPGVVPEKHGRVLSDIDFTQVHYHPPEKKETDELPPPPPEADPDVAKDLYR